MKQLIIDLERRDIENIEFVLKEVAEAINDGFTSGIEFPVNWQLKSNNDAKMEFIS